MEIIINDIMRKTKIIFEDLMYNTNTSENEYKLWKDANKSFYKNNIKEIEEPLNQT